MNPFETYRKLHEDHSSGFGTDAVTLDVPLLLRIMEVCREDIKDDEEIHRFAMQIVALKDRGILSIKDWDDMCTCSKDNEDMEDDESIKENQEGEKQTYHFKITTHHENPFHRKRGADQLVHTRHGLEHATAMAKKHYEDKGHSNVEVTHKKTTPYKAPKGPPKTSPEQRMKARERHWHKTGVSKNTTDWMRQRGML